MENEAAGTPLLRPVEAAGTPLLRAQGILQWSGVDPAAFVRVLRSDLPVDIYPCATDGQFDATPDAGSNNRIYFRQNPEAYQQAVREALGALYCNFL